VRPSERVPSRTLKAFSSACFCTSWRVRDCLLEKGHAEAPVRHRAASTTLMMAVPAMITTGPINEEADRVSPLIMSSEVNVASAGVSLRRRVHNSMMPLQSAVYLDGIGPILDAGEQSVLHCTLQTSVQK
jgi:hypothetical protein